MSECLRPGTLRLPLLSEVLTVSTERRRESRGTDRERPTTLSPCQVIENQTTVG
jgi:hypothetical protein